MIRTLFNNFRPTFVINTNLMSNRKLIVSTIILVTFLTISIVDLSNQAMWIVYVNIVISIVGPFVIFLLIVFESKIAQEFSKRKWITIIAAGLISIFGIAARSYANTKVNHIFQIDPGYFPLTAMF
jgi:hypothetical protein